MDRMLLSALILWVIAMPALHFTADTAPSETEIVETRAPAFFPHDKHMESVESCNACHHRFENGENVLEEDELDGGDAMRCRTCHTDDASVDAREAFHRQCIQCHRALEKEQQATGPRTCGTCHPKKVSSDLEALVIER